MLTHRVLFDEQAIAARVQELARVIARDLPEPTPVLIGPNTRVNTQSTDSSTNIVNVETSALFDALRKSLDGSISDHALQQRLREAVDAMRVSAGTRSFSERYKDFIALAASRHCPRTVLACTYTALAVTGRHVRSTQSSGRPTSRCSGPGAHVVRAPAADRSVSRETVRSRQHNKK